MNRIIVTIRINQKKEYDLELPVHQKIKDLMQDISDSLEGLDPLSWFDPEKVSFMDKRTGRRLNPENSLPLFPPVYLPLLSGKMQQYPPFSA